MASNNAHSRNDSTASIASFSHSQSINNNFDSMEVTQHQRPSFNADAGLSVSPTDAKLNSNEIIVKLSLDLPELHSSCADHVMQTNDLHYVGESIPVAIDREQISAILHSKHLPYYASSDHSDFLIRTANGNVYDPNCINAHKNDNHNLLLSQDRVSSPLLLLDLTNPKTIIGKGQYSTVYKGALLPKKHNDYLINSQITDSGVIACAVKLPDIDDDSLAMWENELRALEALQNSPNVLKLFDVFNCANNMQEWSSLLSCHSPRINTINDISCSVNIDYKLIDKDDPRKQTVVSVLEYASNGNSWSFIKNNSSLMSCNIIFDWLLQTALALEAIHTVGYVHHDIKPHNILVMDDYSIRVCDFGSAASISLNGGSSADLSIDGLGRGTGAFTAPEIYNRQPYNHAVDIYAFGVTIYCWLFSREPFQGLSNPVQLILYAKKGFFKCGANPFPYRAGILNFLNGDSMTRQQEEFLIFLMESCVALNPTERPTASDLVKRIRSFIGTT